MDSLNSRPRIRVIDSLWTFAVATAVVGPLALPLFWRNPRFKRRTKVIVTVAVIVFTIALTLFAGALIQLLTSRLIELQS